MILLGTPQFDTEVSQDAIWFVGAGLAMIFLGLLNLSPQRLAPLWLSWSIRSAQTTRTSFGRAMRREDFVLNKNARGRTRGTDRTSRRSARRS